MPLLVLSQATVAVHDEGLGATVVLLHANPGDARDWDAVVPALLASGRRVVRLDWPGYGDAPAPVEPTTCSAMLYARVLSEALAHVVPAGEPVVLVGNSVGGYAALRHALHDPDSVRGLVLVSPGGFTCPNLLTRAVCRLMGSTSVARWLVGPVASVSALRRTTASRATLRRAHRLRSDPARLQVHSAVWRSFSDPAHDLRQQVASLRVPTLLTWGRADPVLPYWTDGRRARRLLPGSRLVAFASGHQPHAETPQAWLRAVLPFLDDLDAEVAPRGAAG